MKYEDLKFTDKDSTYIYETSYIYEKSDFIPMISIEDANKLLEERFNKVNNKSTDCDTCDNKPCYCGLI